MEDLKPLIRNSGKQRDPVGLTGSGTDSYQYIVLEYHAASGSTYKTNGMQASANQPDRVAKGGEPPNFSSTQ